MPERLERAKRLRLNAERLRAGHFDSVEERALSLTVADNYETLAEALERSAKADGINPAPKR